MAVGASKEDEKQFWKLVWPALENGGWRHEFQAQPAAATSAGSDQSDEPSPTQESSSRRTSARTRKRSTSSTNSDSSRSNNGSGPAARSSRRVSAAVSAAALAAAAAAAASAATEGASSSVTHSSVPVFFPPAVGAASEALEEAMRRSAPADGSLGEQRLTRLVGIDSVIELLQQVPGYPGTTSFGIINFDAVAAAARGMLVRTPSPPTSGSRRKEAAAEGVAGGTRNAGLQQQAKSEDDTPRSRSSSISSSDEAVGTVVELRPLRFRSGMRSSAADTDGLQHHVRYPDDTVSVGARARTSPSVFNSSDQPSRSTPHGTPSTVGTAGPAGKEGSAAAGGAPATAATRLGRVIKKPVRLEEQNPGRQTLAGRNGRADAPARLAARAAVAAMSAAASGEPAGRLSSTHGRAGGQANSWNSAAGEVGTVAPGAGGAERCVARLGTAASNGNSSAALVGASNRRTPSRAASSGSGVNVGTSESSGVAVPSSAGGSVLRMALPADGRTAGLPHQGGDAEEAVGARVGSGEPPRRSRYTVRERDRLIVPDPPPERPVRPLGAMLDEAIKEYKRAYDNIVWPGLEEEFGWKKVYGLRSSDVYFLPPGVARGEDGAKCRVDYFDSNRQVLIHMVEREENYSSLLKRAWAAAIVTPRVTGRRGGGGGGGSKRKRRWTEQHRRKSTMMKKEYPKKVSLVGAAHQVDPMNLPSPVSSEDYVSPEDVVYEQVWDPSAMSPPSSRGAASSPSLEDLVKEFAGAVSHDKCLEIVYRCNGDRVEARKALRTLQRCWKARYPSASMSTRETAAAKEAVAKETAARLEGAPSPSAAPSLSSSFTKMSVATHDRGSKGVSNAGGDAGGGCPIVAGSTTVTATTTRSAVAWGAGAAAAAAASRGTAAALGGGGGTGRVGGAQDAFWYRPFKSLAGGEAGLKRQVEGGVSCLPPGARCRDKLSQDLNLSRPWTPTEAETFSQALLEEGSKNFYAVQKALPDRQVCELVDRYYGGWKQTDGYKALKESIRLSKKQSACGGCHTGGDLICCDGCDAVYHPECVGISVVPDGDWFCPPCVLARRKDAERRGGYASSSSSLAASGSFGVTPGASAGKTRRGHPMPSAETAATDPSSAASSKKLRTGSRSSGGDAGDGSHGGGGLSGGARPGGHRSIAPWPMRMERVPIQLGSARGATGSAAAARQGASAGTDGPRAVVEAVPTRAAAAAAAPATTVVSTPGSARGAAGSAAAARQGASARTGGPRAMVEAVPTRAAAAAASAPATTVVSNGTEGGASGQQLGKRAITRASEQQPGKRPARAVKMVAAPATGAVKAPAKAAVASPPPRLPGGNGAPMAVGEWECFGCKCRNRAEDKRCRQCEGLRLVGAEVALSVGPASTPAPLVPEATAPGARGSLSPKAAPVSTPPAAKPSAAGAGAGAGASAAAGARLDVEAKVSGKTPALPSPKPTSLSATSGRAETSRPASDFVVRAASTPQAESKAASAFVRTARIAPKCSKSAVAATIAPQPVSTQPANSRAAAAAAALVREDSVVARATQAAMRASVTAKTTARSSPGAGSSPDQRSSPWGCRACSTINKERAVACVSCGTRKKMKDVVEEGKAEWWCCRKCSRFNNRHQDGSTCRVCSAVEVEDEEAEEDEEEEEAVSVGEEEEISVGDEKPGLASSLSRMAAAPPGRFIQL